jgi:hypothetical protein
VGTRGAPTNAIKKTFDETCFDFKKEMQSLMTRFEYRGDAYDFTASGSNDAPRCHETLFTLDVACLIVLNLRPFDDGAHPNMN